MKHAVFLALTQKGKMAKVELKLLPEPVESWPANFVRLPEVVVDTCGDAEKDAWSTIHEVLNAVRIPTTAVDDGKAEKEPRKERSWNSHLNHAEANVSDLLAVLLSEYVALTDETEEDILRSAIKHIRNARTELFVGGEGR